jgi:branched-chain amino acid transport system substrate-binding protein
MAVVCDAIAKGGDDRQAVIDAFFSTKGRESPLGTYDIDKDGDTTLSDYGGYKAEGGKLVFNKVIKAQAT